MIDATPSSLATLPAGTLVEGQTFTELEITRLGTIEFDQCTFQSCRFVDASFGRTIFERCVFSSCDLTRVGWRQSSLRGVRFDDCKLVGTNFSVVGDNPEASFEGGIARYAVFDGLNLQGMSFKGCQLQDASFVEADLRGVSFADCDLENAVIRRCSLAGADFSGATGVFFEATQNQSKDAFIAVETAIQMARAAGLRVAGYDTPKGKVGRRGR